MLPDGNDYCALWLLFKLEEPRAGLFSNFLKLSFFSHQVTTKNLFGFYFFFYHKIHEEHKEYQINTHIIISNLVFFVFIKTIFTETKQAYILSPSFFFFFFLTKHLSYIMY